MQVQGRQQSLNDSSANPEYAYRSLCRVGVLRQSPGPIEFIGIWLMVNVTI
jgi:hypothetical protein